MIFWSVPSVGQLKPDTLFGDNDHYGFLQTLVGKKYDPKIVKNLCKEYYHKPGDEYWGKIITISNFLAYKKINEKENFVNIPILDYFKEQFNQDNKETTKLLFEYFLLMWQYPHPINTVQEQKFPDNLNITNISNKFPYTI